MNVQILEVATNQYVGATISPVTKTDLSGIAWKGDEKGRFPHFDWKNVGHPYFDEIYKLERNGIILGITKFFHEERRLKTIELNKIEVSKENYGHTKQYDFIAGCLIAYACLASSKLTGELYVLSKQITRPLYINKYGMKLYDEYYLRSGRENCNKLIERYLKSTT